MNWISTSLKLLRRESSGGLNNLQVALSMEVAVPVNGRSIKGSRNC